MPSAVRFFLYWNAFSDAPRCIEDSSLFKRHGGEQMSTTKGLRVVVKCIAVRIETYH